MSILSKFSKKESKASMESKYSKLAKEREHLIMKKELRDKKREISKLKHPYKEEVLKGASRAGGRIAAFGGELAKESVRGLNTFSRKARTRSRRIRSNVRATSPRRTFTSPNGTDISLSQGIAYNDWHGDKNIMNTEFFGERDNRNYLGRQEEKRWDMQMFGTKTSEENLLGKRNKGKKEKFY